MSNHDESRNGLGALGDLPGFSGAGLGMRPVGALAAALRGVGPREADIASNIRSIAGRMMGHSDPAVRSMAGEILRHVERLETGK